MCHDCYKCCCCSECLKNWLKMSCKLYCCCKCVANTSDLLQGRRCRCDHCSCRFRRGCIDPAPVGSSCIPEHTCHSADPRSQQDMNTSPPSALAPRALAARSPGTRYPDTQHLDAKRWFKLGTKCHEYHGYIDLPAIQYLPNTIKFILLHYFTGIT